jgi:hypothetical protein
MMTTDHASRERQLRKAIKAWRLRRNVPSAHKEYMIGKMRARKRIGKATEFSYNGRRYAIPQLTRHIHDKRLDEAVLSQLESLSASE